MIIKCIKLHLKCEISYHWLSHSIFTNRTRNGWETQRKPNFKWYIQNENTKNHPLYICSVCWLASWWEGRQLVSSYMKICVRLVTAWRLCGCHGETTEARIWWSEKEKKWRTRKKMRGEGHGGRSVGGPQQPNRLFLFADSQVSYFSYSTINNIWLQFNKDQLFLPVLYF